MALNILGSNIRNLRKTYNETLEELALAIGAAGPSTIAQYESGKNTPDRVFLDKIAKHFNITVDQLKHVRFKPNVKLHFSEDKMKRMVKAAFPIVYSEEALTNSDFKKAYNIHLKILNDMLRGRDCNELDYEICNEYYWRAIDNEVEEALANIIWWWMLISMIANHAVIFEKMDDVSMEEMISDNKFLHKYFLPEELDDEIKCDYSVKDYMDDGVDEILMELLVALEKTDKYRDLAFYYVAVKYIFCVMNNSNTKEMNKSIGVEMLDVLVKFGNKYAIELDRAADELLKK